MSGAKSLEGKSIVVTGAGCGIALSCACEVSIFTPV